MTLIMSPLQSALLFRYRLRQSRSTSKHLYVQKIKGRLKEAGVCKHLHDVLSRSQQQGVTNMKQQTANFSNHIWQIDAVSFDSESSVLDGRPILTVVSDVYSQRIAGYSFGSEKPNASAITALLHAIRPKTYITDYDLAGEWKICGSPQFLMVDRSLSNDLDFATALCCVPETNKISLLHPISNVQASAIDSIERLMNNATMRISKFYPMPSVANRSSSNEQCTRLTLKDMERLLVEYFVDEYNQSIPPRNGLKTRLQKWEFGLRSSSEFSPKQSDEA